MQRKTVIISSYLLITFSINLEASDSRLALFPLWNSSWIICQSDNNRVFPSVAPLRPKTIMYVSFNEFYQTQPVATNKYQVRIRWANCNHKDYACTADLIKDVLTQFQSNDITVSDTAINCDSLINIVYNTYNDTVWTLDKALAVQSKFDRFYRKTDGDPVEIGLDGKYDLMNNPVYTIDKPTAWGRRVRQDPADSKKYSIELEVELSEGKTQSQWIENTASTSSQSEGDFTDYCDDKYCYEGVHDYAFKTEKLGYWQVHIFPVICYYPRDAASGMPNLKAPPIGRKEAFDKKKQSVNDPTNVNLKDYRNPYLSDSASSIISLSFTDDGSNQNPMNKRQFVWLSGSQTGSKMQYEHFPTKMYRVESEMASDVQKAILESYSDDADEAEEMATLDTRCPGWEAIDEINSKIIFPIKDRQSGIIKQDNSINTGIFTYNDCPCTFISPYNMTAAQLRKIIYKAVPSCSYESMKKAINFYSKLQSILTAPDDQKMLLGRIVTCQQLMKVRESIYSTDKSRDWSKNEVGCPQTWVDLLP